MRLIDADALWEELNSIPWENNADRDEIALPEICAAPTIDAVPVVRCKDCKYADTERRNATEKRYYNAILFCRNSNLCNDEPLAMWPVDFCSYGVARERTDNEID